MTTTINALAGQQQPGHDDTVTHESRQVAILRGMLENPAEQANWPEIQRAIDYLTATSVLAA